MYIREIDFVSAGPIRLVVSKSVSPEKPVEEGFESFVIEKSIDLIAGQSHPSSNDRIYKEIPAYTPFSIVATAGTASLLGGAYNLQVWCKDENGDSHNLATFGINSVQKFLLDYTVVDFGLAVGGQEVLESGTIVLTAKGGFAALSTHETIIDEVRENTIVSSYNDVDIDSKLGIFASRFVGTTQRVEPFLFFTDPHLFWDTTTVTHAISELDRQEAMSLIQKAFNKSATKFVLCGGDWLTAHKGTEAYTYLSWIDGMMNGLFQDKYFMVNGNHDNNYQGHNAHGEEGGDTIPNQEMVNLLYSRFGNNQMYYSFTGNTTRFYVLDTGIDWHESMTAYRWEQIDWLARELLSDNDTDRAVAMHIISNKGADEWQDNIAPMTDVVTKLLDAYNKRSTIVLNEITYDFSTATGTVHFIIAGHSHYDFNGVVNNIPVIGTTNVKPRGLGHNITFDLVFADYDEHKLYMTRIGAGSDREIEII